eukprot:TRINITY_DN20395_c0_g1_i1.p1 TRINITY_DN20395_c0_g1~~TRINITY_DN20395_c0_g1_i1.p1  ORF type:complete len:436 (+),score=97.59 TRINITY_DN20395_c0_g1_i1:295-1602(+)
MRLLPPPADYRALFSLCSQALRGDGPGRLRAVSTSWSRMASTAANSQLQEDYTDEVLVDPVGEGTGLRVAVLNRPKALNSLTGPMVKRLHELYAQWEEDPRVNVIVLKGEGRAFCAGGDVRQIHSLGKAGDLPPCRGFFADEYRLNYFLATLKKPHVAMLDGVVMGGGNGVSQHGAFRVATEHSLFAMPETAIGLHPDVGASYFLSRLPGYLGEYLGLTGARLNGAEMLAVGLATHTVPSDRLADLEERLAALRSSDLESVHLAILEHSEKPDDLPESSVLHQRALIDECFSKESVEAITQALEQRAGEGDAWCEATLPALSPAKASPTSLKATLRSIREGRRQGISECLRKEYRLTCKILESRVSTDFYEGVRAVLVDKDNHPKWSPPSLEGVTTRSIDRLFSPLASSEELQLPVNEREGRRGGSGMGNRGSRL